MLCMAIDDLYVLGFRNGTGQFYGFKGKFKGTYVLYLILIIYLLPFLNPSTYRSSIAMQSIQR